MLGPKAIEFSPLQLSDLANFQLKPSKFTEGTPELDISLSKDFEGEGTYDRKDTFTTRLTARIIDIEVQQILKEANQTAIEMLTTYRDRLDALAEALLEHEVLDGAQVAALVRGEPLPMKPERQTESQEHLEAARQGEEARDTRVERVVHVTGGHRLRPGRPDAERRAAPVPASTAD